MTLAQAPRLVSDGTRVQSSHRFSATSAPWPVSDEAGQGPCSASRWGAQAIGLGSGRVAREGEHGGGWWVPEKRASEASESDTALSFPGAPSVLRQEVLEALQRVCE